MSATMSASKVTYDLLNINRGKTAVEIGDGWLVRLLFHRIGPITMYAMDLIEKGDGVALPSNWDWL